MSTNSINSASTVTQETEESSSNNKIEVILPNKIKNNVEIINVGDITLDEYNYPEISITFKLLETTNTSSMSSSHGQMWIIGLPQDESGIDVREIIPDFNEWRTKDYNGNIFKEFLEGEPDETITMTFTGENNIELFEKDKTKIEAGKAKTLNAIKKVKKFKLKITQ
jgi:hypothetical protein